MGGCQNYGPFLGTQNIIIFACRIIIGTQKETIILTTTHYPQNWEPLFDLRNMAHLRGIGFPLSRMRKGWADDAEFVVVFLSTTDSSCSFACL